MMIYRPIIRSAIDYGCMAYRTAIQKRLDLVQADALKIHGRAFRTTFFNGLVSGPTTE